jgi:hypothetical protein
MTLVSLPSPIHWPGICGSTASGSPALGNAVTVSAAGHYHAFIFVAREDMTISHVGFRAGTATGSPTIEVRIETVDASGLPSGTLWATNTNGTTGTVTSNTNVLQALTASASITKGQIVCVKIAYASGTSQVIQILNNMMALFHHSLPYYVNHSGSAAKGSMNGSCAAIALGSSSTTFYQVPGTIPISAAGAGGFNNTSSAKRGLRFTPPMNCRAIGMRWHNAAATGDFNAVLYNDAGTELSSSSTAFDGDYSAATANGTWTVYFDNTVTLTAGTAYRIAIEPTTTTNANVSTLTLPTTDYRTAGPAKTTAHYTTFATASWDDGATNQAILPLMDVIIDQVDDGTGSGGGGGQRVFGG